MRHARSGEKPFWLFCILLTLTSARADALELIPERRKDQVQTTPGHILTPAAANIPGLGFTYGVLGSLFNVKETEMDILGFRFWGDLSGAGLGALDLPIFSQDVTLNVFWNSFDKAGIESYRRGIASKHDDLKLIELDSFTVYFAQINWRLFERRLQLLAGANRQQSRLATIRDKEGEIITEGSGESESSVSTSAGAFVDLADDRSDPRRGFQFEAYRYDRPAAGRDEADYFTMEYNGTFYVPVGGFSTWAFNLYRSDAHVTREGETDPDVIREDLGFSCDEQAEGPGRDECLEVEETFVEEKRAANKYGTASSLGGTQRLRSYVTNRYYAAHALAYGTEFRWNLTEEFTPFNIFVASGVRTGVQLAAFAEGGTVSDGESLLIKASEQRYSYGGGVRFILASGFVLRFDLATGEEGTQPTLIFQYPWSVF